MYIQALGFQKIQLKRHATESRQMRKHATDVRSDADGMGVSWPIHDFFVSSNLNIKS